MIVAVVDVVVAVVVVCCLLFVACYSVYVTLRREAGTHEHEHSKRRKHTKIIPTRKTAVYVYVQFSLLSNRCC